MVAEKLGATDESSAAVGIDGRMLALGYVVAGALLPHPAGTHAMASPASSCKTTFAFPNPARLAPTIRLKSARLARYADDHQTSLSGPSSVSSSGPPVRRLAHNLAWPRNSETREAQEPAEYPSHGLGD